MQSFPHSIHIAGFKELGTRVKFEHDLHRNVWKWYIENMQPRKRTPEGRKGGCSMKNLGEYKRWIPKGFLPASDEVTSQVVFIIHELIKTGVRLLKHYYITPKICKTYRYEGGWHLFLHSWYLPSAVCTNKHTKILNSTINSIWYLIEQLYT